MNKYMRVAAVFALAACLGVLGACGKKEQQQEGAALPVSAVKVLKTDLPWNIEYPAQVAGSLEIQVRAQVGGILKARLFDEGAYVKQGTQLFQIDPQEYGPCSRPKALWPRPKAMKTAPAAIMSA